VSKPTKFAGYRVDYSNVVEFRCFLIDCEDNGVIDSWTEKEIIGECEYIFTVFGDDNIIENLEKFCLSNGTGEI